MATVREVFTSGITKIVQQPASQPGDVFPAGVMLHFAGAAAPTGWLICDGTAVSRATYPSLFSAVGTTYGAGDGSTTFNLPDTRGRVIASKHTSGTFQTLGATGGEETHTTTVNEMPSHNHGGVTGNTQPTAGNDSPDHTHQTSVTVNDNNGASGIIGGLTRVAGKGITVGEGTAGLAFASGGRSAFHSHTISSHSHTVSSQGGGAAHNNLQPYIVFNHIIRAY